MVIKNGQTIAFLGDSITEAGWERPSGYVRLVVAGLEANGTRINVIPSGISGHRSNDMLRRFAHDILDHKPDWMFLSCGVNDVWHGESGVLLGKYKGNISAMVSECFAAGIGVMILTTTVIGEELENDNNQKVVGYNEFLRELARQKNCLLADLNMLFQQAIKDGDQSGKYLTEDGVHMNPRGDALMARGILLALGLGKEQLKKAEEGWSRISAS